MYRPISRSTVDRHIGRYVGRESVDITAEWCLPVGRDRQIDRQSVVISSLVCWQCIGESSVEYRQGIGE